MGKASLKGGPEEPSPSRPSTNTISIYGRHAVWEALQSGQAIQKIYLQHGAKGRLIQQIKQRARQMGIPFSEADSKKLRQLAGVTAHQGVVALGTPVQLWELETFLDQLPVGQHGPGLVYLDGIEDPQNMGAILRSAEVLGAAGLLFPAHQSAPIASAVIKASAGAIWHLPLVRVPRAQTALQKLKERGFWLYGAHPAGPTRLWEVDFRRPHLLIVGNEARGIGPAIQKQCDLLFQIPMVGKTGSLNASAAAAICLYEALRQQQTASLP